MTETILCPTRGGPASYPNQDRAIAIAKERHAEVMFLYVSDVRFLGMTASPVVIDLETELEEMGEFLLVMAQERAEKAGVTARTIVRNGIFREVLKDTIREFNIGTVVLGSSDQDSGVITRDYIRELVHEVQGATGAEFIVLYQGEVLDLKIS